MSCVYDAFKILPVFNEYVYLDADLWCQKHEGGNVQQTL